MRGLALLSVLILGAGMTASNAQDTAPKTPEIRTATPPISGIDVADLDPRVRPQDDLYAYAAGGWVARTQGPAYMTGWSAGKELQFGIYELLNKDMQDLLKPKPDAAGGKAKGESNSKSTSESNHRKLADLYAGYMDLTGIDAAGLRPLAPYFKQFDAATGPQDVVRAIALLSAQGLDLGLGTWVHPDDEDPTRYLADFVQVELGLPNRDYYLSAEPRFASLREAYRQHVERVLALSGLKDVPAQAQAILKLEARLAEAQWTQVATRVPGATSHRATRAQLATMFPGFDLTLFADGIGIPATIDRFNVSEPSYFAAYGKLLTEVPASTWQAYLQLRLIDHLARFLPAAYRDESDQFFARTLSGATVSRPRWLRAMGILEDTMGDALGQLYVQRHFPPEDKARAMVLLNNVVTAFRQRITASDWLSEASRRGALLKLDQLVIRMGAPERMRDYASLVTRPDDPVGNWMRARELLAAQDIAKLQRPVDREEWSMSPQSVNGYYSVSRNQVVLPAALLQAPYFRAGGDDAANYGGLGFFIAHELSHAFDRAGSQYDGLGKRVEWMTPADRTEFERRAHALIAQYGGYELAPGQAINGELTIGENIADIAGLAIAYDAYQLALKARAAPVMEGLTGDQRFFLGFARIWAAEPIKTQAGIQQALRDTHTPVPFRVNGAVANHEVFYRAFKVQKKDRMYLAPNQRTRIW